MTQDEPDTCRICSAPAEQNAPLFHPCRCSGTIRYIHQDCLTTWLAHSKKKSCDVCKYQYTFTKVYSENMPNQIPFILFLRKLAQKTFWALVLAIRGLMVATIWLAFLPYVTVWTWRFYFIMGDNIAWWIYDHPRPNSMPLFHTYFTNFTFADEQNRTDSDKSVLDLMTSYPVWRALSADIFTGQIIASLIVLVFLGIFLLREWIIQNARPGVFDEDNDLDVVQDGIEADEPVAAEEPAAMEENVPVEQADEPDIQQRPEERERTPANDLALIQVHSSGSAEDGSYRRSGTNGFDDEFIQSSRIFGQRGESNHSTAGSTDGTGDDENGRSRLRFPSTFEQPTSFSQLEPFSFGRPDNRVDLFQYQTSSTLAFPLTARNDEPNGAGPFGSQPLPVFHPPALGSQAPTEDSAGPSQSAASFVTNLAGPSRQPLPLAESRPPDSPDTDSQSSSGSASESYHSHDSLDSEGVSISSSVPTVADSDYRDDLDAYFPELREDRRGPIRVDELLNDEMPRDDPNQQAEEQELVEAAEDQDNINDDDVDGALEEAVGMRGPLTTVFQNAALMIFVLDTTIGLAVWLPFTIGKTTALLSLEPNRILHLLQWPIRVIRLATDPLVDLLAFIVFRTVQLIMRIFAKTTSWDVAELPTSDNLNSTDVMLNIGFFKAFFRGADGHALAIVRGIDHVANSPVGQLLEPFFARLGRNVRLNAAWLKTGWIELANGDATINRCFAIALGYLIAGILLAIYLNVLNVGNVQNAGRAVRNAIRQQLVVLKVAAFIMVELVVFPLGCGSMLDFCTLQLFPNASVESRLSFSAYAPLTAAFYHWMVGTMFMYQFAILLGGCRKIMRPGALWFIKDPQDQSFHPIRDILDRPTLTQIRKLFISAMMYSFVVAIGMGGLVACVQFGGRYLLPLRWKLREPLSDIPLDLLFLHIVMPSTIKYFRPRRLVFSWGTAYWKWAARCLRLTSYMFGGIHPEEMRSSRCSTSWLLSALGHRGTDKMPTNDARSASDGSYLRVPAQDNISLPREISATVVVDKDGKPLDDAGKRLIELQNAAAEKANRRASDDYKVVYVPPLFKERIVAFILCLWVVGSSAVVAGLAVPILLGRAVFAVVLGREVHDGYTFIVGFYLLWGCYRVGMLLDRFEKKRQRSSNRHSGAKYVVYVFKRSMLWIGNVTWVASWVGLVIPTLLAIVIEVYIVHPLRIMFQPDLTLKIRIFDSWATGLVYMKIAVSTIRLRPETRIDTAIKEMKERGWRELNAVQVTLDIIAPVVAGLLGMLLLPIILVLGLQQILPTKIREHYLRALSCPSIAVLYVYPGIFTFAAGARTYATLQSILASWAQQIRDSEFLVEMRLRNLDSPAPNTGPDPNDTSSTIADEAGLQRG